MTQPFKWILSSKSPRTIRRYYSNNRLRDWINIKIPIKRLLLTDEVLKNVLTKFFNEVMSKYTDNRYLMLLFRIHYVDGMFATLGPQQKINKNDFEKLLQSYIALLQIKDARYRTTGIKNIILTFKIIPDDKLSSKTSRIHNIPKPKLQFYKFYGYNLPLTTDLKQWGEAILSTKETVLIKKSNPSLRTKSDINYLVAIKNESSSSAQQINNVSVISNNKVILQFQDIIPDKDFVDTFTRKIISSKFWVTGKFDNKSQEYHFVEGKLILKIMDRPTAYLKTIKVNKNINTNFVTMDIESRKINNISKPYLISIYDGIKSHSFYLADYNNNVEAMLIAAFKCLMRSKFNQYKIYLHNLSYFDGVFILKILASLPDTQLFPRRHEGKFIDLKLCYGPKYSFNFRDSLLMMPLALSDLTKSFKVEDKNIFPIFAPNDLPLDYIGDVPDFKYFKDISLFDYNKYVKTFAKGSWSLRKESIKYCSQDCISLYQVLVKFNELIFEKFQLNINNNPTLSSLAFSIFRAHYLKDSKIPLITGQMLSDIRQGYFGGATDSYIPSGGKAKNIYTYDVNSLYPYAMKSFPMPIGKIRFFEGDILQIMKKPFGFFDVEITTPNNLKIPILLTRVTKNNQQITMAALGNWKDVIFSEEMFNAMLKFGYKFKVFKGYLFEKDFIFNEYVDSLYEIKCNSNKDDPMYLISKLLLNSLYGKFGMHEETFITRNAIVSDDELYEMIDHNTITDTINFDASGLIIKI